MKITAVVPVYNEEKTIGKLLKVLTSSSRIDRTIVVNGGSTDRSLDIIRQFNVKIINLKKPNGKGAAVKTGIKSIKSGIILLFDGDLNGVRASHIDKLISPILTQNASMVIGLRDKGNLIQNAIMPYFPLIGGERAILAPVLKEIVKIPLIKGWGLENVMNDYCRKKGLKVAKVKLNGVDHIGLPIKKYGLMSFLEETHDLISTRIKLFKIKYQ